MKIAIESMQGKKGIKNFSTLEECVDFVTKYNSQIKNVVFLKESDLPYDEKPVDLPKVSSSNGWEQLDKSAFGKIEKDSEKGEQILPKKQDSAFKDSAQFEPSKNSEKEDKFEEPKIENSSVKSENTNEEFKEFKYEEPSEPKQPSDSKSEKKEEIKKDKSEKEEKKENVNESYLAEGTSNFGGNNYSPMLAFSDDDADSFNDIETEPTRSFYSETDLYYLDAPDCDAVVTNYGAEDLDPNYVCLGVEYGYYEGAAIQYWKQPIDAIEDAINGYDDLDLEYVSQEMGKEIKSKEDFDKAVEEKLQQEVQKAIEIMKKIHNELGGNFIQVSAHFDNGETWYEKTDPFKNEKKEEPKYKIPGFEDSEKAFDDMINAGKDLIKKYKKNDSDENLDEGIKDNLKKFGKYAKGAAAGLAMGASLAGNANAANIDYQDTTTPYENAEELSPLYNQPDMPKVKEVKIDGTVIDVDGNEYTAEDWQKMLDDENIYDDGARNPNIEEQIEESLKIAGVM